MTSAHSARNASAVTHGAPSPAELAHQRSCIEAELRSLSAEREALALSAVAGDAIAQSSIDMIDQDRARKANQIETINSALRTLAQQQREARRPVGSAAVGPYVEQVAPRANGSWPPTDITRNLAGLKRQLLGIVAERRENLLFNHQRGNHRDARPAALAEDVAYADPHTIAIELVTPLVRRQIAFVERNASADDAQAAKREQARLDQMRTGEITRLATELVEATDLPPLPAELAALVSR